MLPPESLKNLVRNFSDPTVGCVSCEDKSVKIEEGKRVADEGLYVRYEMLVRKWESTFGSIVGASGCFYAVRKQLWRKPETIFSGRLYNTFRCLRAGLSNSE